MASRLPMTADSSINKQAQQQQGAASHLGPKGVGARNYGVKTNQMSPGNSGLKAVSQSVSSIGGMLKTKSKRERSISVESVESRNAIPPALETDAKGGKACIHRGNCINIWDIDSTQFS